MKKKLNYPISANYVPDWTIDKAITEILQNFIDFGEFEIVSDSSNRMTISNQFEPDNLDWLLLGESSKQDNNNQIGQHGEGLKLAILILLREGYNISIKTSNQLFDFMLTRIDGFNVSVLSVNITDNTNSFIGFELKITGDIETIKLAINNVYLPEDVLMESTEFGDRLSYEYKNKLYINGLFVMEDYGLKYGYNFPASFVQLDRDRKAIDWHERNNLISKINKRIDGIYASLKQYYGGNKDYQNLIISNNDILSLMKYFHVKNGKLFFDEIEITSGWDKQKIMRLLPRIRKDVKKSIKIKERKPISILKMFRKNIGNVLSEKDKLLLDKIVELSTDWIVDK